MCESGVCFSAGLILYLILLHHFTGVEPTVQPIRQPPDGTAFPENQSSSGRAKTVKDALRIINLKGWICEPCTNRVNGGKMPTKEEIDMMKVDVIRCAPRSGVRVQYC